MQSHKLSLCLHRRFIMMVCSHVMVQGKSNIHKCYSIFLMKIPNSKIVRYTYNLFHYPNYPSGQKLKRVLVSVTGLFRFCTFVGTLVVILMKALYLVRSKIFFFWEGGESKLCFLPPHEPDLVNSHLGNTLG